MRRKKGKEAMYVWVILLVFSGYLFLWGNPNIVRSQEESTCISCHTSVKDLVKITREIAAKKPPQKSAETKGEG